MKNKRKKCLSTRRLSILEEEYGNTDGDRNGDNSKGNQSVIFKINQEQRRKGV